MPIMELRGVSYVYSEKTPFEKQAIHDVNLAIEKEEFIGVIGHTGSGKSTLIQHLNGLLKPVSGQVLFHGQDVWALPKSELRQLRFLVGMVFQYPEHQLFEDTVYRDIAFGPKNMGLDDKEIDRRVRRAAEDVQLDESLLEKSPFELSGGEKRRAAIAGVMAMDPEILVLDEPTSGLDPKGRDTVLAMIQRYRQEHHTTVILVSHSMEDVARVADKVLVMDRGRRLMFDKTDAVFSRADELQACGLAVPAVTRVMLALKQRGYAADQAVYTVDQAADAIVSLWKGGERHA